MLQKLLMHYYQITFLFEKYSMDVDNTQTIIIKAKKSK